LVARCVLSPHTMATGERGRGPGASPTTTSGLQVPIPDHPYAPFLASLEKPARYAGGDVGAVRKPWDSVQARVCLAFPDVFEVGMSHLGTRILYGILNDDSRTLAERCYCPWLDLEAELRRRELPLVSLESRRPLRDFDVVGFSLQFELTYSNVLTMLDLGGIPLRSADRGEDDPLVLAGGPTALHPEPVASFFDAIVVGDGERKLGEVARCWTEQRAQGVDRQGRLAALARLGAVYVPSAYDVAVDDASGLEVVQPARDGEPPLPVLRATVDLDEFPFPASGPTGGPEAVFDRTSLEIARGCHEGCRFCQAGMTYRPMRERNPAQLFDCAMTAIDVTGSDDVSLTALSPADVSFVRPLIQIMGKALAERGVGLGISSLRAYGLAPELLDDLKRMRSAGLTFAPEAGTQRLRDVINKNVNEAQLIEAAERVFARGWNRVKLYFIVGLPTETDEDVRGIVETAARTTAAGRTAARRGVQLTVSVSNHVPKPHTPFQWEAMAPLEELQRKQAALRGQVKSHRAIKLRLHDAAASRLEGVLARGDRRLGAVIERAWQLGARFDSWTEQLRLECWEAAFADVGVEPERYLRALDPSRETPWSHIDVGVEPEFLRRERERALRGKPTAPCGRQAAARRGSSDGDGPSESSPWICYHCGADCDLEASRARRIRQREQLAARAERLPGARAGAGARAAESDEQGEGGPARIGTANAGSRYRAGYEKLGSAALLGHLDLVRELPRIFRRLGVDMVYTAGFHPKPTMSFAPALALGVGGLQELVDFRLSGAYGDAELADLVRRMNRSSPEGLRFHEVRPLEPSTPTVSKACRAFRYLVVIEPSDLDRWFRLVAADETPRPASPAEWLAGRCARLLEYETLEMARKTKGRRKVVDIRPFLRAARLVAADVPGSTLARGGWSADAVCAELEVLTTTAGSAKPSELCGALLGDPAPPHGILRAALLTDSEDGRLVPIIGTE